MCEILSDEFESHCGRFATADAKTGDATLAPSCSNAIERGLIWSCAKSRTASRIASWVFQRESQNLMALILLMSRLLITEFFVNTVQAVVFVRPSIVDVEISPFRSREERASERQQKREAVLRAAVRVFNARGFQSSSLDDVAASLQISKPTIYHYLGNKEQVLLECVMRGLELLHEAAIEAQREAGSGLDRLRRFLCRYAEINMDDFGRCVIRTSHEALSKDGAKKFRALKGKIDQAMRSLIQAGIDDGSIAPVDVKMTAFTLAGALNWPARWHDPDGPMTAEAIAASMVDLLIGGIAPKP